MRVWTRGADHAAGIGNDYGDIPHAEWGGGCGKHGFRRGVFIRFTEYLLSGGRQA